MLDYYKMLNSNFLSCQRKVLFLCHTGCATSAFTKDASMYPSFNTGSPLTLKLLVKQALSHSTPLLLYNSFPSSVTMQKLLMILLPWANRLKSVKITDSPIMTFKTHALYSEPSDSVRIGVPYIP